MHIHTHAHTGQSVTYHIIHPDGQYERQVLGPNVAEGEVLQFVVEGGCWKSVQLNEGGFYCLVGMCQCVARECISCMHVRVCMFIYISIDVYRCIAV